MSAESSGPERPDARPPLPPEFLALTERCLDGTISAEDLVVWEAYCLRDPEAAEHYRALTRIEGLLPDALAAAAEARTQRAVRPVAARRYRRTAGFAAAVLALGVIGWGAARHFIPDTPAPAASVAEAGVPVRVTGAVGVRWESTPVPTGARPASATGVFSAGLLELTLDSGVRLLVQGPAEYAVTGPNSVRLARGRVVADVPPGAKGFLLESARERIVDHGTRFVVEVSPEKDETVVGVLSGEVELTHGEREVRLFTDYAVRRRGDELHSVPLDRERFVTEKPAREFAWNMNGREHDRVYRWAFDVSNLVHGPGDYRVVIRWLLGYDALTVTSLRLEGPGGFVATASGLKSGDIANTRANAPVFHVPPEAYRAGGWTLVVEGLCEGASLVAPRRVSSSGVIGFEEGLSVSADAAAFAGRWRYSHDGTDFVREFLPDGTARLHVAGERYLGGGYDRATYTVEHGVLTLHLGDDAPSETHMLRDEGTLVFLNRPYRAAWRELDSP